jgi:regulatory protein
MNLIVKKPISLKGRALRLLSEREHTRLELERRLASFEDVPGALAQALDELQAKGFISEQRVVESVVHRRAAKLGAMRIRQELQAKGVAPEAVAQAVDALRATELDRAQLVWRKKFSSPAQDAQGRAKQIRFLAARGFGGDTIQKIVSGSFEDLI